ncbi:MAG: 50S ribosomal protein L11 methyltransferase, partial [Candidatus Binatia bacterium]
MAGEPKWFELELLCASSDSDLLTTLLYECGFEGSQVRSQPDPSGGEPRDQLLVYLQAPDQHSAHGAADQLFATLPAGIAQRGTLGEIEPTLWTENWKSHFPRLRIGQTLEILPPWETPSSARGLVGVVINPAMAFGTGHHETTSACLGLLEKYLLPGAAVADVGTGSGILAIAALKLGAHRATASDNDEEAVNAARRNAVIN